jgi:hypothetical protein
MIIYHQHEIRSISCLIFEFRDFGRIMAVGHWPKSQNWGSRGFHHHHEISDPKSIIMPYIKKLGLWPDSRPQAQMTMVPIQKTFLVLRPFEGALTCSILIAETQFMLRKAYFLGRGSWLRPESWTPRPWIQNSGTVLLRRTHQRTYVQNFSSLGAIPAEK